MCTNLKMAHLTNTQSHFIIIDNHVKSKLSIQLTGCFRNISVDVVLSNTGYPPSEIHYNCVVSSTIHLSYTYTSQERSRNLNLLLIRTRQFYSVLRETGTFGVLRHCIWHLFPLFSNTNKADVSMFLSRSTSPTSPRSIHQG